MFESMENACVLIAKRFFMPSALTLKNVPDAVVERLKAAAALNRRSVNRQAIVCLEAVLTPELTQARDAPPTAPSTEELLARLRQFRGLLPADFKFDREEANSRDPE
jgi:antitoxin FitA